MRCAEKMNEKTTQTISDLINYIKCLTTIWKCNQRMQMIASVRAIGTCSVYFVCLFIYSIWFRFDVLFCLLWLKAVPFIMAREHSDFKFVLTIHNLTVLSVASVCSKMHRSFGIEFNCPIIAENCCSCCCLTSRVHWLLFPFISHFTLYTIKFIYAKVYTIYRSSMVRNK